MSAQGHKPKFKLVHDLWDASPRDQFGLPKKSRPDGPRSAYESKCPNYSAASAAGFVPLNWAASVDAAIAVVEAAPPVTATVTASK
jgi:hypothetical protein